MSTPGDDLFADPYEVARDDEHVENVRFGTPPVGWVEQRLTDFRNDAHREPLPAVSGWIEDPRAPSGWRWIENLAEMPDGTPHAVGPPQPYPTPWMPGPNTLDLVDVPERIDGWCENRAPRELTDADGID